MFSWSHKKRKDARGEGMARPGSTKHSHKPSYTESKEGRTANF